MRPKIVAGNWKMNGGLAFAQAYVDEFSGLVSDLAARADLSLVLAPPAILITELVRYLKSAGAAFVAVSAQNVAAFESGAYTGELSAGMLGEAGCRWAIVGHSERRALFGETDQDVVAKVALLVQHQLKPIVCVGETLAQRENGQAEAVVAAQVQAVLNAFSEVELASVVFAYEPVWAIGTGQTATPAQAQAMHASIRQVIGKKSALLAQALPILYGGSVNAANAGELFAQPDIDGGLVGGASLKPGEFAQICKQMG